MNKIQFLLLRLRPFLFYYRWGFRDGFRCAQVEHTAELDAEFERGYEAAQDQVACWHKPVTA